MAEEEAAAIEARMLREAWHGPRPAAKTVGQAMLSYAEAVDRSPRTYSRLIRLYRVIGENTPLSAIGQDTLTRLRGQLLKPDASPATFAREIIEPLRAVLRYAARQGWCPEPHFVLPKRPHGRTLFFLPAEAERLIAAAPEHIRALLVFLIGTGARVSEALGLEWRDVDLAGGRAVFWADQTKSGKRRIATLPPRVIAALGELPRLDDRVFLHPRGPYELGDRSSGGNFRDAWITAIRRAGLNQQFTPHVCRHTFATWHYALHKDVLALKAEGGWGSVSMVERYAKLMPAGYEEAIRQFLGAECNRSVTDPERPLPILVSSH